MNAAEEQIQPGVLWAKSRVNFSVARVVSYGERVVVQDVARAHEGEASHETLYEHAFRAIYKPIPLYPPDLVVSAVSAEPEGLIQGGVLVSAMRDRVFNYFLHFLRGLGPAQVRVMGYRGPEQWLAWAAVQTGIPLVIRPPFIGFNQDWSGAERSEYEALCRSAASVEPVYAAPLYSECAVRAPIVNDAAHAFVLESDLLLVCWRGGMAGRIGAAVKCAVANPGPTIYINNPDLLETT